MPLATTGFQAKGIARNGPGLCSRASEAASNARLSANRLPVAARRHGNPIMLTTNNASKLASTAHRSGASARACAERLRQVFQAADSR